MSESEVMLKFPLHCAVRCIRDTPQCGNVIGYTYNLFQETVLVVKWFYQDDKEIISSIHHNSVEKV